VSVETLISRLYLVSDVLFNSQQPNVKHAFFYRSAVESMAPAVFSALGSFSRHQQSRGRRWTRHHKLATCVHVVLQAWSAWDVYPPAFLQELQALFDGREVDSGAKSEGDAIGLAYQQDSNSEVPEPDLAPMSLAPVPVIREGAQGNWTTVEETVQADTEPKNAAVSDESRQEAKAGDGEPLEKEGDRLGGGEDDDPDGEPLEEEDRDGESFEDEDPDGEPLDDGDDGEPIDGDEILEQLPRVAVLSEPED
jgi:U2-associated protein SR140